MIEKQRELIKQIIRDYISFNSKNNILSIQDELTITKFTIYYLIDILTNDFKDSSLILLYKEMLDVNRC